MKHLKHLAQAALLTVVLVTTALGPTTAYGQTETGESPPAQEVVVPPAPETESIIGDANSAILWLLGALIFLAVFLLSFMVWRLSRVQGRRGIADLYRPLIEGMVLVMVVVAVIILGVGGKLTQEGIASVLAAVVGYAAGRSVSGSEGQQDGQDPVTPEPPSLDGGPAPASTGVSAAALPVDELVEDDPAVLAPDVSPEATAEAGLTTKGPEDSPGADK